MTDLKIEAGKCYETRGGFRAYIAYQDWGGSWCGILRQKCKTKLFTWNSAGLVDGATTRSADIISEWKESRKGEVYVSIHHSAMSGLHVRAFDADDQTGSFVGCLDRIALIGPIPWTEGQGLDGEGSK